MESYKAAVCLFLDFSISLCFVKRRHYSEHLGLFCEASSNSKTITSSCNRDGYTAKRSIFMLQKGLLHIHQQNYVLMALCQAKGGFCALRAYIPLGSSVLVLGATMTKDSRPGSKQGPVPFIRRICSIFQRRCQETADK